MPDLGGLRRGIGERAKQATQQISQAGLQQFENLSTGVASRTPEDASGQADEAASTADVTAEVSRLRALLERRRPPPGPVRDRWAIGIGDLLAEHPRMPNALRGLSRTLDRYGGLAITPQAIEFDHDAVEWTSVTEIRTRNVVDYLFSDALGQQLDTIPLPWFPGRRKVLDALSKAMLTLLLAAAKQQLDQHGDIRIPAEIEYRGTVRRHRQLAPGVLAALVLADPAVNDCLHATAGMYGIIIRPADDAVLTAAGDRADQLRSKLASIESRLGGGSQPQANPALPDDPPPATEAPRPTAGISAASPPAGAVIRQTPKYQLPDQGHHLMLLARAAASDRGAAAALSEIGRVRRADGALAHDDLLDYKKDKDGPLHKLKGLLYHESLAVSAWSDYGFGMLQKRSARKQVEEICRSSGVEAAVDWAMANGSADKLRPDSLRSMIDLESMTSVNDGQDVTYIHVEDLRKIFKKWQ